MEKFFKVCLTVLTIWNSFGTEKVIVSAEGKSSGISYFVFQQPAYPRDCKEVSNTCSSTHNTSGVYLIKPDGYPEPFEAYCDNDLDTGGWTVVQRRRSDSVNFNRNWKDFRNGFGFLGSEFWIGNEKIAVLTNQKRYQLRMDFENVAGDTYYVTYDEFRISDEWGNYYISSLGTFVKSDGIIPERCPANEIFSSETCERTCDDPDTCISPTSRTETEQCVCVGDYLRQEEQCIPRNQCNCFVADKGSVLTEGQFYANSGCTRKSTCRSNRLIEESYQCSEHATCDTRTGVRKCYCNQNYHGDGVTCTHNCFVADKGSVLRAGQFYANSRCTRKSTCRNNRLIDGSYQCSAHATCDTRNNDRKCYCNDGYEGDGVTCTRVIPKDCYDLYVSGTRSDGVHTIYPDGWSRGIQVYCEMESNGGGWTVIQRRSSSTVEFYRTWAEYKNGFENPNRDHWLGNDYIHAITNQKTYSLRIDLTDSSSSSYYALYSSFSISDEADKYRLSIGSYSGNAGSDAMSRSNNKPFSTRDRDNDESSSHDCAEKHQGAWWFAVSHADIWSPCPTGEDWCEYRLRGRYCAKCSNSHLNGDYDGTTRGTNIYWSSLTGYDCGLQYTNMKIRPV